MAWTCTEDTTNSQRHLSPGDNWIDVEFTGDTSFLTAGENPSIGTALDVDYVYDMIVTTPPTAGYTPRLIPATSYTADGAKIALYEYATGGGGAKTAVATGTNLAGMTFKARLKVL